MSAFIWLSALIVGYILPFSWKKGWVDITKNNCDLVLIFDHFYFKYILFPVNFTSVFTIIFMYIHIFHVAHQQVKQQVQLTGENMLYYTGYFLLVLVTT